MIEVYTDGASNVNTGLSGAGIFIKAHSKTYEYSLPLGKVSNHEAEFQAVIKALEICEELFPNEILSFRSDSQVVVDVIEKTFTKNKTYEPLLTVILEKASSFPYFFMKWIPSSENIHADKLAKQAIYAQQKKE